MSNYLENMNTGCGYICESYQSDSSKWIVKMTHRNHKKINNSPLAKQECLRFCPDDFAFKLIGTTGDHAANQKRGHEILQEWKIGVIFQWLGEEALFNATRVHQQILDCL